ncbi:hypothetical protein EHP00_1588 [Ecytonucleospora hepatopenaei]|uniref:5'-3' DNA helicase ZGRF1-like N-terminal domain-containing protein n=1 Tax=Ecytonucleospora hepatopenaei TaxID=646526 RepID=A0A1W0E7H3_9MICR|nr:hypothetical protein EHP00_1588 [Ecytonucleospora hepatopenaei]
MKNCTYTKDPKIKKKKKYLDGFVSSKNMKVTLYDSNKKILFTSSKYAITDDETLNIGLYTVIVDDFMFLQDESKGSLSELDKNEGMLKNDSVENNFSSSFYTDKKESRKKIEKNKTTRRTGRSDSEILDIFMRGI